MTELPLAKRFAPLGPVMVTIGTPSSVAERKGPCWYQPPALLVWGRHDIFFDLAEVLSWMRALPRMEAHVLDGGHLLLETHAGEVVGLVRRFVGRTLGGAGKR